MDVITVGVGFVSFGIFLIIHVVTFRWLRPEELLRSLLICVLAIAGLPLVLMGILFYLKAANVSVQIWVFASLLALLITGLLCFVYVMCVFGPNETSVRMRLVREIAKGGADGITRQELLGRYNARTITDVRLRRLMGSGDIIEKDGLYQVGNTHNFFLLFDVIAGEIKKWIGR